MKTKAILFSLLFSIILTVFPVASSVIAINQSCTQLETYWIQGIFMMLSVFVPLLYLLHKKITFKTIGFTPSKKGSLKTALYFLPFLLAKMLFLIKGITLDVPVLLALLFFTIGIGLSEELYFRGLILQWLLTCLSIKQSILISTLFFGIVHASQAFSGVGLIMTLLTIANALLFGVIASELVLITESLLPIILLHTLFDFINWISLVNGTSEFIITFIQSIIMTCYAIYLWGKLPANKNDNLITN